MTLATNLGFPRIGVKRELKKAVEAFWSKESTEADLQKVAAELRKKHWQQQQQAGIDHIPSNDFSFYDQVLDTIALTGAVPARYKFSGGTVDLKTYFAMARGAQGDGLDVVAMEMTKWFDTNYHYIVPEFSANQRFALCSQKPVAEFLEAKALGITTRPVLVGPVSFLLLGKMQGGSDALSLLPELLPVYQQVLKQLAAAGAEWVQIDEPYLCMDLSPEAKAAFTTAYEALKDCGVKIITATYFDSLRDNTALACGLPTQGLHIDLVRAPEQLDTVLAALPAPKILSLGLVNGRNIWKTNLRQALSLAEKAKAKVGTDRLFVAGSCSLLHSPVDLGEETKLDAEFKNWLAFAVQKLAEIKALATGVTKGEAAIVAALKDSDAAAQSRATSARIHDDSVKARVAAITASMAKRRSPFDARQKEQQSELKLPLFPTTTIGSFPQTKDVREARATLKRGEMTEAQYNDFIKQKTQETVRFQEEIDIDVLVHGEFERNDMVEYFGELLRGFAFTKNGWVQSYGSRCVKPPIIFGDVARPAPMTVEWACYAQSLTKRYMKGMLTGPVTMLQWSFVRDDQPRDVTCRQIALAIRDEVMDLEKAGIKIIQIDEPAFREGLPLRHSDWQHYLNWAVECFQLSAAGVEDTTQIHTHMCYSEFNDIMPSIGAMDADVISIETSRSNMELLESFTDYKYPNEIGPGVYDIHSPRTPDKKWMEELLRKAVSNLEPEQVWVNPDCGLKTRKWSEVKPALKAMVDAAKTLRREVAAKRPAA